MYKKFLLLFYFILIALSVIAYMTKCFPIADTCKDRVEYDVLSRFALIKQIKEYSLKTFYSNFPSPHAELLLGMTLGFNELKKVPTFNDILRDTGTIHVVVVSGFNISLVLNFIIGRRDRKISKFKIAMAIFVSLSYAVISGFEPPVIRAWLMGVLIVTKDHNKSSLGILHVLLLSSLGMLVANISYIFSLSYQLSFLATLGLIVLSDNFLVLNNSRYAFMSDLKSTLSAQVFVWPLISYVFGLINLLSLFVNPLILWLVPYITVVGILFIIVSLFNIKVLTYTVAYLAYCSSDIFIKILTYLSKYSFINISYKISFIYLITYFLFLFAYFKSSSKRRTS